MIDSSNVVPVTLVSGQRIMIEVASTQGEEDVAFAPKTLKGLSSAMQGIAAEVSAGLESVRPDKLKVEFGVQVAVDSGNLTALVAKGNAAANFKVTLEWGSWPAEEPND